MKRNLLLRRQGRGGQTMDMDTERLSAVRSREELRFEYVDEQGWDASCGYAALATLLGRYRGRTVNEESLLHREVPGGGSQVVKVSLAGLTGLARDLGFEVRAWRTSFDRLPGLLTASAPLLVHYDRPQGHFALVLAAGPEGVVTADPARGLELLTRGQFLARWSGVAVEVVDPLRPGAGLREAEIAADKVRARTNRIERALSKSFPPG